VPRQCPLEPDEEEIREVRVGNRVVVRRISEPHGRCLIRQQIIRSISKMRLADADAARQIENISD
jgi:hypothetical protein